MFCFVSHGYTSISQGNYLYNLSIQFMFMLGNYNNHTIAPMSVNISDPVVLGFIAEVPVNILERLKKLKPESRGFETLWDFAIRRLSA